MCSACEHSHGRRWTGTRLILLAFVATLLALSTAGLVARVRASDSRAVAPCAAPASAAVRFQSAVTRDIGKPARLRSDTAAFLDELRALGGTGCQETRRFLLSAERTIAELCPTCAADLRSARAPRA